MWLFGADPDTRSLNVLRNMRLANCVVCFEAQQSLACVALALPPHGPRQIRRVSFWETQDTNPRHFLLYRGLCIGDVAIAILLQPSLLKQLWRYLLHNYIRVLFLCVPRLGFIKCPNFFTATVHCAVLYCTVYAAPAGGHIEGDGGASQVSRQELRPRQ
jgi:hypothetical protein